MIYKRIDINRPAHNIVQKNRATHKCITRKFVFNSCLYYNGIMKKFKYYCKTHVFNRHIYLHNF